MELFAYNPFTFEYVGKVYFLNVPPANTTEIEPPVTQKYEVAVYNNGSWKICKDFRGQKITNTTTKKTEVHDKIGEIPDGFTTLICPDENLYSWVNDTWLQDENLYRIRDKKARSQVFDDNEWMINRHNSELRLLSHNKIESTTLTEDQILELDIYFNEWRNFMNVGWYVGKPYPEQPSFLGV